MFLIGDRKRFRKHLLFFKAKTIPIVIAFIFFFSGTCRRIRVHQIVLFIKWLFPVLRQLSIIVVILIIIKYLLFLVLLYDFVQLNFYVLVRLCFLFYFFSCLFFSAAFKVIVYYLLKTMLLFFSSVSVCSCNFVLFAVHSCCHKMRMQELFSSKVLYCLSLYCNCFLTMMHTLYGVIVRYRLFTLTTSTVALVNFCQSIWKYAVLCTVL